MLLLLYNWCSYGLSNIQKCLLGTVEILCNEWLTRSVPPAHIASNAEKSKSTMIILMAFVGLT